MRPILNSLSSLVVLGSTVGLVASEALAQQTDTIWVQSVEITPTNGWDFEGQIIGNPGCGACPCNANPETYAVNTQNKQNTDWLVATAMDNLANSVPVGSCINRVWLNVQGRYDSGDTGQIGVGVLRSSGWSNTQTSPTFAFGTNTDCQYIWPGNGLEITDILANGGSLSVEGVNNLQVRARRVLDSNNTTLRINAYRVKVEFSPPPTVIKNPFPSPQISCPGGVAKFCVEAANATGYPWRLNGVALQDGLQPSGATVSGATSACITISDSNPAMQGAYDCVVFNDCESAASTAGSLTSCVADCDCSDALNIDDFICFQTYFANNSSLADCDTSGSLTIDDFICFQTLFAIGC